MTNKIVPSYEMLQKGQEDSFAYIKFFATARINNFTLELCGGNSLSLQNYQILVNAANENLILGGGIAGEIRNRAGNEVEEECKAFLLQNNLTHLESGQICTTLTYNLKNFAYIFHTVGPRVENNRVTDQNKLDLFNSVQACISHAIQNNLNSIVIPAISCGIFGYPLKEAVEIHYNALFSQANSFPLNEFRVCFCLFKKVELREFYEHLRNKFTSFDSVQFFEDNA